jgi:hypothetical protein
MILKEGEIYLQIIHKSCFYDSYKYDNAKYFLREFNVVDMCTLDVSGVNASLRKR